jgi:hypothetical protein
MDDFISQINVNLTSNATLQDWDGSDVSWWLAKLASKVNIIGRALDENPNSSVKDAAIDVASLAFIITSLQQKKVAPGKKKKRVRRTKTK